MTVKGTDYAFNPHPNPAAMVGAGVRWVGRYVSPLAENDTNGKNLLVAECKALLAAELDVILFAESTAGRMLGGHAAGVSDAKHFDQVSKALGMPSIVMYCAADFDATPAQQTPINAYLDGASSIVGAVRVGVYGGYHVVKRTLNAGKAKYACQTPAWSGPPRRDGGPNSVAHDPHCVWSGNDAGTLGTNWDERAQLRQHLQIRVGGVSVDLDESRAVDFGQWPRPVIAKPAPSPPVERTAPGGKSLRSLVHAESTTVARALWLMAQAHASGNFGPGQARYVAAGDWDAPMSKGVVYWVG